MLLALGDIAFKIQYFGPFYGTNFWTFLWKIKHCYYYYYYFVTFA